MAGARTVVHTTLARGKARCNAGVGKSDMAKWRVWKLEAGLIDGELETMFTDRLVRLLSSLVDGDTAWLERWSPELSLVVSLAVTQAPLLLGKQATFGASLNGLVLGSSAGGSATSWRLACRALVHTLLAWGPERAARWAAARGASDCLAVRLARWLPMAVRCASLINLIAFLARGVHPTLADRLLALRLQPVRPSALPAASAMFVGRQLAWAALSDAVLALVPLVPWTRWRARVLFLLRSLGAGVGGEMDDPSRADGRCAVCQAPSPVTPWRVASCPHVFCYYCLHAHLAGAADGAFGCPECGVVVREPRAGACAAASELGRSASGSAAGAS